jgi:hypothetical protein
MWLATKLGFYSIIRKASGEIQVRARKKKDLKNLMELLPNPYRKKIIETPKGDYGFRLVCDSNQKVWLSQVFNILQQSITYDNFKNEISHSDKYDQKDKLVPYNRFWLDMMDYQVRDESVKAPWK